MTIFNNKILFNVSSLFLQKYSWNIRYNKTSCCNDILKWSDLRLVVFHRTVFIILCYEITSLGIGSKMPPFTWVGQLRPARKAILPLLAMVTCLWVINWRIWSGEVDHVPEPLPGLDWADARFQDKSVENMKNTRQ